MHADVCAEVQANPAENLVAQQRSLDRWRQEFNHVRPHEALGGKTPSEVYKVVERRRPSPHGFAYPKGYFVRRVAMTARSPCAVTVALSFSPSAASKWGSKPSTRRIVGWATNDTNDGTLALAALGDALQSRRPRAGLIHHTDRGSPYASDEYRAALSQRGHRREHEPHR